MTAAALLSGHLPHILALAGMQLAAVGVLILSRRRSRGASAVKSTAGFAAAQHDLERRASQWREKNTSPGSLTTAQAPAATLGTTRGAAELVAACLSLIAAAIHASVAPEHFQEDVLFGVFFVVSAVLQSAWAIATFRRASRWLWRAAIVLNAPVIALWLVSRTVGLPIGPEHAEHVGLLDAVASTYELAIVFLAVRHLLGRNVASVHAPRPTRYFAPAGSRARLR